MNALRLKGIYPKNLSVQCLQKFYELQDLQVLWVTRKKVSLLMSVFRKVDSVFELERYIDLQNNSDWYSFGDKYD